jgi:hypothetical protein
MDTVIEGDSVWIDNILFAPDARIEVTVNTSVEAMTIHNHSNGLRARTTDFRFIWRFTKELPKRWELGLVQDAIKITAAELIEVFYALDAQAVKA